MCPGGVVVAAASVTPEDYGGDHPLQGMYWQRQLEEKAFVAGGRTYAAPAQRVEDLLKDHRSSRGGVVIPSYGCGVVWRDFKDVLPPCLIEKLKL